MSFITAPQPAGLRDNLRIAWPFFLRAPRLGRARKTGSRMTKADLASLFEDEFRVSNDWLRKRTLHSALSQGMKADPEHA